MTIRTNRRKLLGGLIFLQKLRISLDAAFSFNVWSAFLIFIAVIGGIGTLEGPIIGTLLFFALRETLADFGTIYLFALDGGHLGYAESSERRLGLDPRPL